MATVIIFASSLFMASILVFIKYMELRSGTKNIALKFISRLDSKANQLVSAIKFKNLQLMQSVRYIVLVQSKIVFKNFLNKATERILNEYKMRQSIIMGHREIVGNGSASFYLKKITENKGNVERGKIEESL
jgi:hypothetical protein